MPSFHVLKSTEVKHVVMHCKIPEITNDIHIFSSRSTHPPPPPLLLCAVKVTCALLTSSLFGPMPNIVISKSRVCQVSIAYTTAEIMHT